MIIPFGVGGQPRRPRATVENTARIFVGDLARSLFTPPAREGVEATASAIRVVINGKPEVLDVVHEPCNYGGDGRWFFLCGTCSKKVLHLYLLLRDGDRPDGNRLACRCRRCAGITYKSQFTRRRGINRVRRLRAKIGALPHVLAPLPQRPQHVRRDYWRKSIARIVAAETLVAAELRDMLVRARRRLRDEQRRDSRARTAGRSDRRRDSQRSKSAGGSQGVRA